MVDLSIGEVAGAINLGFLFPKLKLPRSSIVVLWHVSNSSSFLTVKCSLVDNPPLTSGRAYWND
jgi:hypothetical protein